MPAPKIKLLVVDDSALARKAICDSLAGHLEIEIIGTAADPYIAREKILSLNPDVMTLDIEMPRMDGLTFLKLIMRHRPMPVVVLSSLTQEGSSKALEALQSGAVEVIGKPSGSFSFAQAQELVRKIKAAAEARLSNLLQNATERKAEQLFGSAAQQGLPNARALIVLGASTGGTEALKTVLTSMPADLPPICVVQHIPAQFSGSFANRLNSLCAMDVREARHGDELEPGLALIAPGGKHLTVWWSGSRYVTVLSEGPPVHHQRPSVDVLFDSVVKAGGARNAVAALLTGMGRDGADAMLRLRENGAYTVAQSEATCVVFGMPREAIQIGAAQDVLDLEDIGPGLVKQARKLGTLRTELLAS